MSVELLYNLQKDPESYWIVYDLCLENNWADIGYWYLPQPIFMTTTASGSGRNGTQIHRVIVSRSGGSRSISSTTSGSKCGGRRWSSSYL